MIDRLARIAPGLTTLLSYSFAENFRYDLLAGLSVAAVALPVAFAYAQLAGFDLWVSPVDESADDGDVLGFLAMLAAPLQATASGHPLPDVVSVSYGECESQVSSFTASRTLVERQLTATAALGIAAGTAAIFRRGGTDRLTQSSS